MAARLTLEFDDQTAPEFAELVKRLEEVDAVATEANTDQAAQYQTLQSEVEKLRNSLAQMEAERSQAVQTAARESQFLAGAVQESGRIAAEATVAPAAGYLKWKVQIFLLKQAAKAAAVQLTGMAAAGAAAVAPAITAAAIAAAAYKTLNGVLENTGQNFAAIQNSGTVRYSEEMTRAIAEQAGIHAKNNEQLIQQLNAMRNATDAGFAYSDALERLQKAAEATGQSIEELGIEAESNASRIGDAFGDLGDRLSEPFERSADAIAAWWNSSSLIQTVLDTAEGAATRFADALSEDLDDLGDKWDELRVQVGRVVGANEEEYRREIKTLRELEEAQERVAKAQEKAAPHFEALKAANRELEEEAKLKEKLDHINTLRSDQIDDEIFKLSDLAGRAAAAGQFKGKHEKEYTTLFKALTKRREEALRDEAKAVEETAKLAVKAEEKRLEAAKKRSEEEAKLREEAARAEAEFWEERFRGLEELDLQERRHRREMQTDKLKESKGNEKQITRLLKEELEERAELELQFAKTAADAERIQWQLERDLRELDHKHALELQQQKAAILKKETEDREQAAQKQIEIERAKIDKIKGLTNNQGQNLFEELAGRQSNKDILEEITKKRLAQSRQNDPNAKGARRRQMDDRIKFQARQEAQQGRINPGEVAKARAALASRSALELARQGAFNKETLKAIAEQAKAYQDKASFDEEVVNQITQIQETLREQQGGTKNREQRLRAQRRGNRG